ncbi:MAG: 50S ribosomal protein L9 [Lachnospiraceae bacterium]|jgi:large subunit ribosomal protein L9|nr:50S ribosomal protein L9 [Lachnospiraceae bacterium]MCI1328118.1 50S ribosomal protein L9 [Lachnospiraceae bacterium]
MKVILLQDVKSLGKRGDVVNVSDGYARNMLLPKKLGVEATPKTLNDLKLQTAHEEKLAAEALAAAKELAEQIGRSTLQMKIKVGEGGKTFGSISAKEIVEAAKEQYGFDLDKKKVQIASPIRELGAAAVAVRLHPQVTANLKINVTEA